MPTLPATIPTMSKGKGISAKQKIPISPYRFITVSNFFVLLPFSMIEVEVLPITQFNDSLTLIPKEQISASQIGFNCVTRSGMMYKPDPNKVKAKTPKYSYLKRD